MQKRRATRWILAVLVLVGLIALVRVFGEERRFAELARQAQPRWLVLAFAFQLVTYPALALAWRYAIRRGNRGKRAPGVWPLVGLALAELFLDQAVPSGGLAGTAFMVTALRRRGVDEPLAAAAVGAGLFGFYVAQLAVVLAAVASFLVRGRFVHWAVTVAAVSVVAAIAIPACMFAVVNGAGSLAHRLRRFGPAERVRRAVEAAPREVLFAPATIAVVAALRVLIFVLDAATLGACLAALGVRLPVDETLAAVALASTAGSISFLPGGIGSFEAIATGTLVRFGASLEAAAAAVLLMRGFAFWLPMLPGFLLAIRNGALRSDRAAPRAAPGRSRNLRPRWH